MYRLLIKDDMLFDLWIKNVLDDFGLVGCGKSLCIDYGKLSGSGKVKHLNTKVSNTITNNKQEMFIEIKYIHQ